MLWLARGCYGQREPVSTAYKHTHKLAKLRVALSRMASLHSANLIGGARVYEISPASVREAIGIRLTEAQIAQAFPDGLDCVTRPLFLMTAIPPAEAVNEQFAASMFQSQEEREATASSRATTGEAGDPTGSEEATAPGAPTSLQSVFSLEMRVDRRRIPFSAFDASRASDMLSLAKFIHIDLAAYFVFASYQQPLPGAIFVSPRFAVHEAVGTAPEYSFKCSNVVPLDEAFLDTIRDPEAQQSWKSVPDDCVEFFPTESTADGEA